MVPLPRFKRGEWSLTGRLLYHWAIRAYYSKGKLQTLHPPSLLSIYVRTNLSYFTWFSMRLLRTARAYPTHQVFMAPQLGLEPRTSKLTVSRYYRLSYWGILSHTPVRPYENHIIVFLSPLQMRHITVLSRPQLKETVLVGHVGLGPALFRLSSECVNLLR